MHPGGTERGPGNTQFPAAKRKHTVLINNNQDKSFWRMQVQVWSDIRNMCVYVVVFVAWSLTISFVL